MSGTHTRNIIRVFEQATEEERIDGIAWYSTARDWCQSIADKHELPLRIVVGVCAALSPTNKWARNIQDTHDMCRVFTRGGYVEECKPSTYKKMRDKAWSILQQMPRNDKEVLSILNGAKISDFYLCIMGSNVCVIDGHAWCIANNDRRTMQEIPNIGKKLRQELQQSYANAGKKFGYTAYEMQAITWVTWKRIHNV